MDAIIKPQSNTALDSKYKDGNNYIRRLLHAADNLDDVAVKKLLYENPQWFSERTIEECLVRTYAKGFGIWTHPERARQAKIIQDTVCQFVSDVAFSRWNPFSRRNWNLNSKAILEADIPGSRRFTYIEWTKDWLAKGCRKLNPKVVEISLGYLIKDNKFKMDLTELDAVNRISPLWEAAYHIDKNTENKKYAFESFLRIYKLFYEKKDSVEGMENLIGIRINGVDALAYVCNKLQIDKDYFDYDNPYEVASELKKHKEDPLQFIKAFHMAIERQDDSMFYRILNNLDQLIEKSKAIAATVNSKGMEEARNVLNNLKIEQMAEEGLSHLYKPEKYAVFVLGPGGHERLARMKKELLARCPNISESSPHLKKYKENLKNYEKIEAWNFCLKMSLDGLYSTKKILDSEGLKFSIEESVRLMKGLHIINSCLTTNEKKHIAWSTRRCAEFENKNNPSDYDNVFKIARRFVIDFCTASKRKELIEITNREWKDWVRTDKLAHPNRTSSDRLEPTDKESDKNPKTSPVLRDIDLTTEKINKVYKYDDALSVNQMSVDDFNKLELWVNVKGPAIKQLYDEASKEYGSNRHLAGSSKNDSIFFKDLAASRVYSKVEAPVRSASLLSESVDNISVRGVLENLAATAFTKEQLTYALSLLCSREGNTHGIILKPETSIYERRIIENLLIKAGADPTDAVNTIDGYSYDTKAAEEADKALFSACHFGDDNNTPAYQSWIPSYQMQSQFREFRIPPNANAKMVSTTLGICVTPAEEMAISFSKKMKAISETPGSDEQFLQKTQDMMRSFSTAMSTLARCGADMKRIMAPEFGGKTIMEYSRAVINSAKERIDKGIDAYLLKFQKELADGTGTGKRCLNFELIKAARDLNLPLMTRLVEEAGANSDYKLGNLNPYQHFMATVAYEMEKAERNPAPGDRKDELMKLVQQLKESNVFPPTKFTIWPYKDIPIPAEKKKSKQKTMASY